MKRIGLAVMALVLGLVACSSPELNGKPQLGAQFGTAEDDIGLDVATVSTGRIYGLSKETVPIYKEDYDGTIFQSGQTTKVILRRFDGNGKTVWVREVDSGDCDEEYGNQCSAAIPISLVADTKGNVNVLYRSSYTDHVDVRGASLVIAVYSATGENIKNLYPIYADYVSGDFALNSSNQTFIASKESNLNYDTYEYDISTVIRGYTSTGGLSWQRTSTVGDPTDIIVTSSGSVYVTGTKGLARYSTTGNLIWTKAIGPLENVIVSGSNIYTRYRKDIRKFDGNGKQLWLKTQTGLNTLIGQDISGDTNGNVYLSGKYAAGTGNYSPFVRKLNSSGTVLWTKTYGTPAYDDALGVATITGSEIYVTGETQGSLAHTNIGGRDGYLRKLNSTGNPVWTR